MPGPELGMSPLGRTFTFRLRRTSPTPRWRTVMVIGVVPGGAFSRARKPSPNTYGPLLSATPGLNMFPGSFDVLPGDTSSPLLSRGQTTSTSTRSVVSLFQPRTTTPQLRPMSPGASSKESPHSSSALRAPLVPDAVGGGAAPTGPVGPLRERTIAVKLSGISPVPRCRTVRLMVVDPGGAFARAEKPSPNMYGPLLSATPGLNMFPGSLEVLPGDTSIPLLSLGQTTSTSTGSVVLLRQPSTITPQPLLIWPGAS